MGLRSKLLAAPAACALLAGAYMVVSGATALAEPVTIVLWLLLPVGAAAAGVEIFVIRPLRDIVRAMQELEGRRPPAARSVPHDGMRALADSIGRVRDRLQGCEDGLAHEHARRLALEQSGRELERCYSLVVERANDGVWEWNVRDGAVAFSVRWKSMLRWPDAQLGRLADWEALLHPADRAGIVMRIDNHVAGLTPHFEEEYRVRAGDGRYRWVHSRGAALRHANGKAYRMVVMDNDIQQRKELEESIIEAAEGLSAMSGADFYRALLRSLATILGTRDNLVCYCLDDPPTRVRTLAYYSNGEFRDIFEFDLAGTSCAAVIERREIVYCPSGLGNLWPQEKQYDRDSYIGVPMFDSSGKIIGHFACMDAAPMRHDMPHLALFKIFSVRAAAELERTLLRQKLAAGAAEGAV